MSAPAEARLHDAKYPARAFTDLIAGEVPEVRSWIEPGVLPKSGKALIGGEAKIGKSWLNLQLGKDTSLRQSVWGHPQMATQGAPRILYCEQEINAIEQQVRIKKAFVGVPDERIEGRLWGVSRNTNLKIDNEAGLSHLRYYLDEVQPNILILDPATKLMHGDGSNNRDVTLFWESIDRIIEDYRELELSVVVTHHFGKPSESRSNVMDKLSPYNFRGASVWYDAPDTLITLVMDGDKRADGSWHLLGRCTTRHETQMADFRLGVHAGGQIGVKWLGLAPKEEKGKRGI